MVPSWGDGGFDFGIETTRAWSGKLGKPLVLDGDITSANHSLALDMRRDTVLEGLWADPQPVPPWELRRRKRVVKSVRGARWLWRRCANLVHQHLEVLI